MTAPFNGLTLKVLQDFRHLCLWARKLNVSNMIVLIE